MSEQTRQTPYLTDTATIHRVKYSFRIRDEGDPAPAPEAAHHLRPDRPQPDGALPAGQLPLPSPGARAPTQRGETEGTPGGPEAHLAPGGCAQVPR